MENKLKVKSTVALCTCAQAHIHAVHTYTTALKYIYGCVSYIYVCIYINICGFLHLHFGSLQSKLLVLSIFSLFNTLDHIPGLPSVTSTVPLVQYHKTRRLQRLNSSPFFGCSVSQVLFAFLMEIKWQLSIRWAKVSPLTQRFVAWRLL